MRATSLGEMEAIGYSTVQCLEANAARGKLMLAPGGGACMKENCTHHVLQLRVAILRVAGKWGRRRAQSAGRRFLHVPRSVALDVPT